MRTVALPADLAGTVLVTNGDMPLLTAETLVALAEEHTARGAAVTVLTARRPTRRVTAGSSAMR